MDINNVAAFFRHLLERIDWRTDLHFETNTTIDTLDYSGSALNEGSKVVLAAAGPKRRELGKDVPTGLRLPDGFADPRVCLPGILAVRGPTSQTEADAAMFRFCESRAPADSLAGFPLIVIVDDSEFTARTLNNCLWVTFTRSNPAADIYGIGAFTQQKHWGCTGPLVINARIKPHHAPPLEEDPEVTRRIEGLAARGGPLHGLF